MRFRVETYLKPYVKRPFNESLVLKRLTPQHSESHSIESFIAVEAKISQLMRGLELLEARE